MSIDLQYTNLNACLNIAQQHLHKLVMLITIENTKP